jgi:hypothetical protein
MVTALWLKDLAERVVRTALQAVISAPFDLTAAKTLIFVALSAGFAVIVEAIRVLLASAGPYNGPRYSRGWFVDALERLILTFVQAFIAALLTNGSYDLTTARSAAIAGIAAAVSFVMSLLAQPVPRTLTPASLVKAPPGPHRTA